MNTADPTRLRGAPVRLVEDHATLPDRYVVVTVTCPHCLQAERQDVRISDVGGRIQSECSVGGYKLLDRDGLLAAYFEDAP